MDNKPTPAGNSVMENKITKEQIQLSEVRMLTLNEPFASLMAFHGKQETRNRDTKVRGLVAIHAAKLPYQNSTIYNICGDEQYYRIWNMHLDKLKYRGKIIAVGYLVGTKYMADHPNDIAEIEDKCYVKYRGELWIWEFEDMTPVEPVSIKGKQGWKILTKEEKGLLIPAPHTILI